MTFALFMEKKLMNGINLCHTVKYPLEISSNVNNFD